MLSVWWKLITKSFPSWRLNSDRYIMFMFMLIFLACWVSWVGDWELLGWSFLFWFLVIPVSSRLSSTRHLFVRRRVAPGHRFKQLTLRCPFPRITPHPDTLKLFRHSGPLRGCLNYDGFSKRWCRLRRQPGRPVARSRRRGSAPVRRQAQIQSCLSGEADAERATFDTAVAATFAAGLSVSTLVLYFT